MDRHAIGLQIDRIETYHEKFKVRLSSYVEALKIDFRSRDIISFYTSIINDIGYSIVLNCDKDEIFQSFFYALQFGLNHFKLASNPNKEREIQVGKTTIKTVGKETRDYIDFGTWMTVFYTAVILRDKKAIDFLTGLENRFMKQGNVSFDDVRIAEVEVYKVLFEDSKYLEKAIEIYELKEKEFSKTNPSRNWIDNQGTPVIMLCKSVLQKDAFGFNDLLEKALNKHKEYFSKKDRAADFWGWVSFPLLMICSYAYDNGISITVESDYIPRWLFEGNFKDCELNIK